MRKKLAKLTRADEGRRLGGAVPQGTLFGSLEKAFSPRGASPPTRGTPRRARPGRSDAGAWGWGSAVRVEGDGRRPPRTEASGGSTARTTTRGRKDAAVREQRERAAHPSQPASGRKFTGPGRHDRPRGTCPHSVGEVRRGTAPVRVEPRTPDASRGHTTRHPTPPRERGEEKCLFLPQPYRTRPPGTHTSTG